jgi:DNA polymerase III subunit gamma/tau
MTDILTLKYRPQTWKEVIGQDNVVRSFKSVLAQGNNRTFLLHGPSGIGKTTLARIAAKQIGCEDRDIYEENAANRTGIDDTRMIIDMVSFKPLGGGTARAVILDECHRLSAPAFAALLKPLEEPPEGMHWFLCTTDPAKVPNNIQTRCTKYALQAVAKAEMAAWLQWIAEEEQINLGQDDQEHDAIIDLCAREAQGSPRAALINLGAVLEAKSKKAAAELLRAAEESPGAIDLARALTKNSNWQMVMEIVKGLNEPNPESVRHVVRQYVTTILVNSTRQPDEKHLAILEAFSTPFNSSDGISPLVLACGRLFFGG